MAKFEAVCYCAKCDECGEKFADPFTGIDNFSDETVLDDCLATAEWTVERDRVICPDCVKKLKETDNTNKIIQGNE